MRLYADLHIHSCLSPCGDELMTPNNIVGMAYLNPFVKAINVSYDGGRNYVHPSIENARAKKYPIVRPLYYYYNKKDEEKVRPYIQFITSEKAENISLELGFIPATL